MNEAVRGAVWRKRMQDLSRNVGQRHAPLFAPLLFAAAAQIEAIEPWQMASDATRLRKNVGELRRVLGTDAVVCAVPSGMEAEALGVAVEGDQWPPKLTGTLAEPLAGEPDLARLTAARRLSASLEAVRQWQADGSEPVIVAALTGPATLLAQLRAAGTALDDKAGFEMAGSTLAALARLYAEAGIHVLQLHEDAAPGEDQIDEWKSALSTIGNVARFHRVPPVLVVSGGESGFSWPPQAVACPTTAQHPGTMTRAHGRAWPSEPGDWPTLTGLGTGERLVTTVGEVTGDIDVAALRAHAAHVRGE